MSRYLRAAWGAALVAGSVVGCSAISNCGEDAAIDAGVDARVDARDAATDAKSETTNVACNDASQGTRWAGWSRVTEADPCCTVEVPDQVDASVESLTWAPCANDAGGCQEIPTPWITKPAVQGFPTATVSPTDNPKFITLNRLLDFGYDQIDVHSLANGMALGSWRFDAKVETFWTGVPVVAGNASWVMVLGSRDAQNIAPSHFLGRAPTPGLALHPSFVTIPDASGIQELAGSDTTFAFDVEPVGKIGRVSVTEPTKFSYSTGGNLILPLVHGDDVFAQCTGCNGGWANEVRVDPTGTTVPLRAKAGRHVANFATDGTTLFWTESYGANNTGGLQPTTEVWSAPYTSNPATLESTAKKIGDANGANGYGDPGIAFSGFYAIRASGKVTIIRSSDGASQQVVPGPGRIFASLVYVTATELWSLTYDGSSQSLAHHFQRQTLGSWP